MGRIYLGKEEVSNAAVQEGASDVTVTFKDGSVRVMPYRRFQAEQTDKPIDLTELRERRSQGIVQDILTVLLAWDMPLGDFEHVISLLGLSLDNLRNYADNSLWGKNVKYDLSMADLDRQIKKTAKVTEAPKS